MLGLTDENSIDNLGPVKWDIALCLLAVFTIVYFAMWKGVKSSGKVGLVFKIISWQTLKTQHLDNSFNLCLKKEGRIISLIVC